VPNAYYSPAVLPAEPDDDRVTRAGRTSAVSVSIPVVLAAVFRLRRASVRLVAHVRISHTPNSTQYRFIKPLPSPLSLGPHRRRRPRMREFPKNPWTPAVFESRRGYAHRVKYVNHDCPCRAFWYLSGGTESLPFAGFRLSKVSIR
jgi:hypothetical protein